MRKKIIWILLADAGYARIVERAGPLGELVEIQNLTHSHESTHEHGPDQPGRGFESSGKGRHAYEPPTDWHEQQKDNFAKELVTLLHHAHEAQKFDELYILAPPKILGFIRHHMSHTNNQMASKISKEMPKDAVSFTLAELKECIDGIC
jgi:protein required for attachment to host cells